MTQGAGLFVRTVLADVPASSIGTVNYHEHLFQRSPLLPGDALDDVSSSTEEARDLMASGFATMVNATPIALARNPEALAQIASVTGLHIVATSGAHREAHYGLGHWVLDLSESELASAFTDDVREGMPPVDMPGPRPQLAKGPEGPVRAGMLKAGVDYWSISQFERRVLAAVATAHRDTGAPVMIHLESGSAAFEVLSMLADDGVPADRVVLAHIDRNPDPGLHAEIAQHGAYLGYDGFARHRNHPDSVLIDCMLRAAATGARDRLLIGGDVARRRRYLAYGGMPGLGYLGRRVLPRIAALDPSLVQTVTQENPARLLGAFTGPADPSEGDAHA